MSEAWLIDPTVLEEYRVIDGSGGFERRICFVFQSDNVPVRVGCVGRVGPVGPIGRRDDGVGRLLARPLPDQGSQSDQS